MRSGRISPGEMDTLPVFTFRISITANAVTSSTNPAVILAAAPFLLMFRSACTLWG